MSKLLPGGALQFQCKAASAQASGDKKQPMRWEGVGSDLKGFKINREMERSEREYNWGRVHSWSGGNMCVHERV